jgi:hypothetical protein
MPLCNLLPKKTEWPEKLRNLIEECPVDVHQHMKFPVEWTELPFWKLNNIMIR